MEEEEEEELKECSECNKKHPADCVWRFRLVSLGEKEPRLICKECIEEIKKKIVDDKDLEEQIALVSGGAAAGAAAGGIKCSECGETRDPCDIWKFLLKSLGETEPRWIGTCCIMGVREKIRANSKGAEKSREEEKDDRALEAASRGEKVVEVEEEEEIAVVPVAVMVDESPVCSECENVSLELWRFRFVSLLESGSREICRACAPTVRDRVVVRQGPGAVDEIDLLGKLIQDPSQICCCECGEIRAPDDLMRLLVGTESKWLCISNKCHQVAVSNQKIAPKQKGPRCEGALRDCDKGIRLFYLLYF